MNGVQLLSLYRRVLRLHQIKLNQIQRSVGDQYARQEFRAHLKAKPEHQKEFLIQWQQYISHLELEADLFGVGRDLSESTIESLTDDQRLQLDKLRHSTHTLSIQTQVDHGKNPYDDKK